MEEKWIKFNTPDGRIHVPGVNIKSMERLQDISEDDSRAEGVEEIKGPAFGNIFYKNYDKNPRHWIESAYRSFMSLWKSINGADSLNKNPWVWVIEFMRVK